MVRRRGMLVVSFAAVSLAVGCGGGSESHGPAHFASIAEGRTTTTSAALTVRSASVTSAPTPRIPPRVETASAVMRVTTARCDREAACGHVGTGRSFGDRDECANSIGHDIVAAMPAADCPTGIDAERLRACTSAIDAASCDARATKTDGADDGDLPAACALDQLCPGE